MTFHEFEFIIHDILHHHPEGLTWKEIKTLTTLPYSTPCPTWIARLESEIGLKRIRRKGNSLIWELNKD